jgi:homoserine O-acetyltransferase
LAADLETAMPEFSLSTSCSYELTGAHGAPLVVVLGGISATRHVSTWWADVVGEHRFIDTTTLQVLGIDYLDGGVEAGGGPARGVTTRDQADAVVRVLDRLEIERIHTLVGASYGGMVALAFAERHADRVDQLVVISAPARAHPMTAALRAIQRRIVELGLETGRARKALAIARALGMTTYRTSAEFARRFDADPAAAESYVIRQGEKFAARFTPSRFLALSLSCDHHRVDPARIRTPALLISVEGDTNVPREQMVELAELWGGECRLVHVPSLVGHDAFLAEPSTIGGIIQDALNASVLS